LFWSCGVLFVGYLAGCSHDPDIDLATLTPGETVSSDEIAISPFRFRTIFYHFAKSEISYQNFMRLALVPDADIYRAPQTSFDAIDNYSQKFKPETYYRRSLQFPPPKVAKLRKIDLPPMTLVVVPGTVSEIASGSIFPEATDNKASSFARTCAQKLGASHKDHSYLLAELGEVDAPLSDFIQCGSIDDSQGHSLINVVVLFPKFGSLETIGRIEEHYSYYKRRLDKLFSVIGPQPRIYLSGHSRGTAIALDILARVVKDTTAQEWVKQIEGFVALDGVVNGIHWADAWFSPHQRPYKFHQAVSQMTTLKEHDGLIGSMRNRSRMTEYLVPLGIEFFFNQGFKYEPGVTMFPDLVAGFGLVMNIDGQFRIRESYFGDYARYVRRIRIGTASLEDAILSLTHKERLEWFKNNTLPTEIRYYSVNSTFFSPVFKDDAMNKWQKALFESPFFNTSGADYAMLRGFSYDHYAASRIAINDGFVGIHEGTFWPELHRQLNPAQKPYKSMPIGLFATHHTGLTYSHFATSGSTEKNPFPRKAFLKALAYFTGAEELREKDGIGRSVSVRTDDKKARSLQRL
jgi:hypothetical protein